MDPTPYMFDPKSKIMVPQTIGTIFLNEPSENNSRARCRRSIHENNYEHGDPDTEQPNMFIVSRSMCFPCREKLPVFVSKDQGIIMSNARRRLYQ